MASAVAASDGKLLCAVPFKVRRWEGVTTESDTVVVTHGESESPDIVLAYLDTTIASDSALAVVSRETSATTFTIDCEDDGNDTFSIVAMWFPQGSGGIS